MRRPMRLAMAHWWRIYIYNGDCPIMKLIILRWELGAFKPVGRILAAYHQAPPMGLLAIAFILAYLMRTQVSFSLLAPIIFGKPFLIAFYIAAQALIFLHPNTSFYYWLLMLIKAFNGIILSLRLVSSLLLFIFAFIKEAQCQSAILIFPCLLFIIYWYLPNALTVLPNKLLRIRLHSLMISGPLISL